MEEKTKQEIKFAKPVFKIKDKISKSFQAQLSQNWLSRSYLFLREGDMKKFESKYDTAIITDIWIVTLAIW